MRDLGCTLEKTNTMFLGRKLCILMYSIVLYSFVYFPLCFNNRIGVTPFKSKLHV